MLISENIRGLPLTRLEQNALSLYDKMQESWDNIYSIWNLVLKRATNALQIIDWIQSWSLEASIELSSDIVLVATKLRGDLSNVLRKKWTESKENDMNNREYFIKNARYDYGSCYSVNNWRVNQGTRNLFKDSNWNSVWTKGYLSKLWRAFWIKLKIDQLKKWKKLAWIEEMNTRQYFIKNARYDYESCNYANNWKVNTGTDNPFKCSNLEKIGVKKYLGELWEVFWTGWGVDSLKKWRELVWIEEMNHKEYFIKNAKYDYESCTKANNWKVTTAVGNPFKCSNSEKIIPQTYLLRIWKAFLIDWRAGQLKKWRELAWNSKEFILDEYFEKLSWLGLEDAISLLRDDPLKLKFYIQFAHPEFSEDDINKLISTGFKAFHSRISESRFDIYLKYNTKLKNPEITYQLPKETEGNTFILKWKALWADFVYIWWDYNRRIKVDEKWYFMAVIPLKIWQKNEFRFISLNTKDELRSKEFNFEVRQIWESNDIEALITLLSWLREEITEWILEDEQRYNLLLRNTQHVLIKKFTHSFEDWCEYIETLSNRSSSEVVTKILVDTLTHFTYINELKFDNINEDTSLYFFQKYCICEIQRKIEAWEPWVILANEPWLWKTVVSLVTINWKKALIISPNAVVSTWWEEARKFLKHPSMLVLQNMSQEDRKKKLRDKPSGHIVTNIDFLQQIDDEERFELLSRDWDWFIVYDEAHSRKNLNSKQTQWAMKLEWNFLLMLSASPFKDPKSFRRMMHNINPLDLRFVSDSAFEEAFPEDDPQALKALNLLAQSSVIRFKKQDVMEELDTSISLEEQKDRLPKKNYIDHNEHWSFELGKSQCYSVYEMFLNWWKWCEKNDKYVPKDKIAKLDWLRGSWNLMAKQHALRQTVNNLDYIWERWDNQKDDEMKRIVNKSLSEWRKPIIFCRYNAQAKKYAKMFKDLNPASYTWITNSEWEKKWINWKPIKYMKLPDWWWALDENGYPIECEDWSPILALDYERITFQKAKDRKLIISTSAWIQWVTFTAWKTLIFDDLPRDYVEQYQAEDRPHRIDNEYKTHYDITYYKLISKYPQSFLEEMKQKWVRKLQNWNYEEVLNQKEAEDELLPTAYDEFFKQWTWDHRHYNNLLIQKDKFQLLNDWIIQNDEFYSWDILNVA